MTKKSKFYIVLCSLVTVLAIIIICVVDHVYYMTCPTCNGEGEAYITCSKCNGEKYVECDRCYGRGRVRCSDCDGRGGERCGMCSGTGVALDGRQCFHCGGSGVQRYVLSAKGVALNIALCAKVEEEKFVLLVVGMALSNAQNVTDKLLLLVQNVMQKERSLTNVRLAKEMEK